MSHTLSIAEIHIALHTYGDLGERGLPEVYFVEGKSSSVERNKPNKTETGTINFI